ncbi:ubiquitin carboxyl-terminal hydrolase [Phanerochaete sordida]|uniref:Ubiquitin carboxyl-terminal hydrolase n=1 Tax=Phanerochaete sordida TaxID=48140 RepID=A0A9P3LGL1_9APHY|nr:ubiquitin carboxyl-terminal hydrolase [Phanerochaete sordida]
MLRHKKQPTPQELYRARKQREEEERDANLPPGLINHGNTCFMNSTLQGLIATPLLHSLVAFEDLPPSLAPYRSPQLTNGHGLGGKYEHERVQEMPLGDVFIATMQKAWAIQQNHRRESMSPRDLLDAIGRKYDQYQDFRQQDAHEFLRHMLDAMRMEELDVIKVRQPPAKKRRRAKRDTQAPDTSSAHANSGERQDSTPADEEKLESFVDMLFGGKLASILVCDTCKKVSVTYEDFNDLSLSIKPEDYVKERRRDRFKHLARKFRIRPKETSSRAASPHRSSSVPASPARRSMDPTPHDDEPPINVDHRRRSFDHVSVAGEEQDNGARDEVKRIAEEEVGEAKASALPPQPVSDVEADAEKPPHTHVAFTEPDRDKAEAEPKKDKEDGWGKLGRRLSMSVGMSKKEKRQSRSKDRGWKAWNTKDSDTSRAPSEERRAALPESRPSLQSRTHSVADVTAAIDLPSLTRRSTHASPLTSPLSTPPLNISNPLPNFKRFSAAANPPTEKRQQKPPRPPKPTRQETAYLRQLLADVHPSVPSTFSMLHQAISGGSQNGSNPPSPSMSAQTLLAKLGHMPGIEECLRLFTSVEVLDGENMVGCHRCWKIANGTYQPRRSDADEEKEDSSEGSEESAPIEPERPVMTRRETFDSTNGIPGRVSPASTSYISASAASSSIFLQDTASISSAPTTIQSVPHDPKAIPISTVIPVSSPPKTPDPPVSSFGGLPIPSISTTEPDTPTTAPGTAQLPSGTLPGLPAARSSNSSLVPPKERTRKPARQPREADDSSLSSDDGYDSSDASDADSAYSEASSVASPSVSRKPSLETAKASPPRAAEKVPKAQQVILRRTFKRYLIAVPPPVLVVHLKRFQQVNKTNPYALAFSSGFKKLDDFVAFPEHLDLAPFLAPRKEDFGLGRRARRDRGERDERCMYRLYAVVVHIGNMLGGHYVAYTALPPSRAPADPAPADGAPQPSSASTHSAGDAKGAPQPQPRRWAYISDTVVRLTTLEEVLKAKAYICMYERI